MRIHSANYFLSVSARLRADLHANWELCRAAANLSSFSLYSDLFEATPLSNFWPRYRTIGDPFAPVARHQLLSRASNRAADVGCHEPQAAGGCHGRSVRRRQRGCLLSLGSAGPPPGQSQDLSSHDAQYSMR